ncbi:DMT family transporter [Vibrio sp. SCSIO 43136]|uniref:DMT family transporter n=1 Tax=Vibrio sp. SCSIO 43136 TaxID=2819101 RepID=UPI002075CA15|nr:DMT family transporter [Vibrio sp. SCSIO 43136]USD67075.1 DMT family transporter [Vibrio sp. SCSIO 43136]
MKLLLTTLLALIAFAANSLLARVALAEQAIDASSYTLIRLGSGALFLALFVAIKLRLNPIASFSRLSLSAGFALLAYALLFSFAYLELSTGTGALLLFGAVQLTLVLMHVITGNKLHRNQWVGLTAAIMGFVVLMLPNAQQPDLLAAMLMIVSGIAWAVFTMLGKKLAANDVSPVLSITHGFIIAAVLSLAALPLIDWTHAAKPSGVGYAIISGVLASGAGYVIWYQVLAKLSLLQAAVSQLMVPVIAFAMGVGLLDEQLAVQSVVASLVILTGIALVVTTKQK